MKALILDGSDYGDEILTVAHNIIKDKLESNGLLSRSIVLRSSNISPCMGCFDCWLKTPGTCVINDSARNITNIAVESDIWFFLTPMRFGGYSSNLKKAVDRLLPIFVPVFTRVGGEVHHRLRYEKHPILIGIGHDEDGSEDKAEMFKKLISRNAINFRSPYQKAGLLLSSYTEKNVATEVNNILDKIGG